MRRPETVKVDISQGDWLLVKKHLTSGEHRKRLSRMLNPDGTVQPVNVGVTKIVSYLLDWSIADADDKPVVIRDQPEDVVQAALDALDVESFKEILTAIEAHEDAMQAVRDAEKNVQGIESPSSPLSLSAAS